MAIQRPLQEVSLKELRKKWKATFKSDDPGFYVGVAGEPINDVKMPRWNLVREAEGPDGVAVYEDDFGNFFAVADENGPYASLIHLN